MKQDLKEMSQESTSSSSDNKTELVFAPYQENAVRVLQSKKRMILGSAAGTGKSIVAVRAFTTASEKGRCLIITKPSLVFNFRDEIIKWGEASLEDIQVIKKGSDKIEGRLFTILPYSLAEKKSPEIAKISFSHLICDEAHTVKSIKAQVTKAVLGPLIARAIPNTYLLTGTPFPSKIVDSYVLFNFCLYGALGTRDQFIDNYSYVKRIVRNRRIIMEPYGTKLNMLDDLVEKVKPILHRDELDDVQKQLPPFSMNVVRLYKTPQLTKLHRENKAALVEMEKAIEEKRKPEITTELASFRRDWGVAKVPVALAYIETILEEKQPLLIFTWHVQVAQELRTELAKHHKVAAITGSVDNETRQNIVNSFQSGALDIIIATIPTLSEGFNITRASHTIFVEEGWTSSSREQAMARTRRIGQKNRCVYTFLIIEDSIDEIIYRLVSSKASFVKKFWDKFQNKEIDWDE